MKAYYYLDEMGTEVDIRDVPEDMMDLAKEYVKR
jgi:hypothetical protein